MNTPSLKQVAARSVTSDDGPSRDELFTALANRRRRYALHYLLTTPGPVRIREMTLQIAAWECHVDPDELTRQERKRVYTALHQTHLPKLRQLGFIEYDSSRGTAELAVDPDELTRYLGVLSDDATWWRAVTGLGGVLAVTLAATLGGVIPFTTAGLTAGLVFAVLLVGIGAMRAFGIRPSGGDRDVPLEVQELLVGEPDTEPVSDGGVVKPSPASTAADSGEAAAETEAVGPNDESGHRDR